MHFESSPFATYTKEVLGAFSRFMCPNTKLFTVKVWKFSTYKVCKKKFWAHFH